MALAFWAAQILFDAPATIRGLASNLAAPKVLWL